MAPVGKWIHEQLHIFFELWDKSFNYVDSRSCRIPNLDFYTNGIIKIISLDFTLKIAVEGDWE